MEKDLSRVASEFKIGTLVLAKMKGFPFWPGVITEPPQELKKAPSSSKSSSYCIFFFGSKNYSWIEADKLKLYSEHKDELCKTTKAVAFKKACEEIDDYITKGLTLSTFLSNPDPFDTLRSEKGERKPRLSMRFRASASLSESNVEPLTKVKRFDQPSPLEDKKKLAQASQPTEFSFNDSLSSSKNMDFASLLGTSSMSITSRPESPTLDIEKVIETLGTKNIVPSSLRFGFIGLGKMGSGLLRNLLDSKHIVTVWNRTPEKCEEFIEAGALGAMTPGDVIADSDITFCCVSGNDAAREIVYGKCGVLPEIKAGKSFVEMSAISIALSHEIADAITASGGRYLEVRFQGSKSHADKGTLNLMAAGERTLYDDCSSCFSAFCQQKTFLGEVGKASSLGSIFHSLLASELTTFSVVMQIADIMKLSHNTVLQFFEEAHLVSPFVLEKYRDLMTTGNLPPQMTIGDLQRSAEMALRVASKHRQKTPLIANVNEFMKKAMGCGHSDDDIATLSFMK